jgi:hypothetical protein
MKIFILIRFIVNDPFMHFINITFALVFLFMCTYFNVVLRWLCFLLEHELTDVCAKAWL